jgi:hypothetical protein
MRFPTEQTFRTWIAMGLDGLVADAALFVRPAY